jgi:hypothetical protein
MLLKEMVTACYEVCICLMELWKTWSSSVRIVILLWELKPVLLNQKVGFLNTTLQCALPAGVWKLWIQIGGKQKMRHERLKTLWCYLTAMISMLLLYLIFKYYKLCQFVLHLLSHYIILTFFIVCRVLLLCVGTLSWPPLWSEFLATDPEALVRFPALPEKKKM